MSTVCRERVFVGPIEIAGIAEGLVKGFREQGISAKIVLSAAHPFKYGSDDCSSWLLRTWQKIGSARHLISRDHLFKKVFLVAVHGFLGWLVFLRLIWCFDSFIFIFGQTITNSSFELWLLRCLGRKIVFVYAGSDSRPPYMDGARFPGLIEDKLPSAISLLRAVRRCKRKICLHEKYADYVVNSPATAHFHERPYINWFSLGMPKVVRNCPEGVVKQTGEIRPVKILHGPSNPLVKGTAEILAVLERLQQKGHPIQLVKIQGVPNEIVLQELAFCDFIVDQLYSDTPLAAFATEAAYFGKPAVVGGYFANIMGQCLNTDDIPPCLFVLPDDLEMAVERLIVDTEFRQKLGEQARQFVLSRWSFTDVAGRYLQLLQDDIPAHWWCDPTEVNYLQGCGLPEGRSKKLVALLLDNFGISALHLQDKPRLEKKLVEFARTSGGENNA